VLTLLWEGPSHTTPYSAPVTILPDLIGNRASSLYFGTAGQPESTGGEIRCVEIVRRGATGTMPPG
jgi:hypothetical protein